MRQISIANNEFGSEGVAVLADFIGGNYCAKDLWLDHNKISDSDTPLLASALRTNTHLHRLDLAHNNIAEDGRNVLLKALFDTTTMNAIVESNHTCFVNTCFDDYGNDAYQMTDIEAEVSVINCGGDSIGSYTVGKKIRKKVVLSLCCRHDGELFDLSHFNIVPLQLMPRVLELIQEHTQHRTHRLSQADLDKEALSRLVHTLRGWKMPALFENLSLPTADARKRKRN